MRAVWRLSTSALAGRRKRTLLLVAAVALSTALVSAIACAMASMNAGMATRVAGTVGTADLQVRHIAKDRLPASVVEIIRAHPGVTLAVPRTREAVWITRADGVGERRAATLDGVDPALDARMYPVEPAEGRGVMASDEMVIRDRIADDLGVGIGDTVIAGEGDNAIPLRIVGLVRTAKVDIFDKAGGTATIDAVQRAFGTAGTVRSVGVTVAEGSDTAAIAAALAAKMPRDVMVRESERVTSRIDRLVRVNDLMFSFTAVLAYAGAAVIVLTGLTTAVLERQRELAVVRCIGGTRWQLGASQLGVGLFIGTIGAIVGVPVGIALAWVVTVVWPERLPAGLQIWPVWLVWSAVGAALSGVVGALWPAVRASRARPITAMASKARRAGPWGVVCAGVIGAGLVAGELALMGAVDDPEKLFPTHPFLSMPMLVTGWFLVAVPVVWLVGRVGGPLIAMALGVPRRLLIGSIGAAPFRNGFTAGALMVGLGMMTAVYTNGTALLRDWIEAIRFPDAFVNGVFVGITPDMRERIEALDFVDSTCAITILKIDSPTFGIAQFLRPKTNFVAFEPGPFFEMTRLHWVAGDPDHALRRLEEGGAVLVSQEFMVHRPEFGVGAMYPIEHNGRKLEFEIVGAVSSPGLDLVSKYFQMEDDYSENALHAVFGTRADLVRFFGTDAIHLLQLGFSGGITDEEAVTRMREAAGTPGLYFGSARSIKEAVIGVGRSMMGVASIVAFGAMVIGSLGVVNVVVAGIDARRFEFGVLRSVGASGPMVGRLVIAEVVVIALGACIVGLGMGLHASWSGIRVYALVGGIEVRLIPPVAALAGACGLLIALTLVSVTPMVVGIARLRPRLLLGATRG
jgi:putative ABC transport system permease protein